jgi:hypothetical protein
VLYPPWPEPARREPGADVAHRAGHLLRRERAREQVALADVAAQADRVLELLLRLDPLGHDEQAEVVRQRRGGRDDGRPGSDGQVRDERPVDLQRRQRQLEQARHRRPAGAEVVDRDVEPRATSRCRMRAARAGSGMTRSR